MGQSSHDCSYCWPGKGRVRSVKVTGFLTIFHLTDKSIPDVILNYLYDVYERNIDIQVRFKWTPYSSGAYDRAGMADLICIVLTLGEQVQPCGTIVLHNISRLGIMKVPKPAMGHASRHWQRNPTLIHSRQVVVKHWALIVLMPTKSVLHLHQARKRQNQVNLQLVIYDTVCIRIYVLKFGIHSLKRHNLSKSLAPAPVFYVLHKTYMCICTCTPICTEIYIHMYGD